MAAGSGWRPEGLAHPLERGLFCILGCQTSIPLC